MRTCLNPLCRNSISDDEHPAVLYCCEPCKAQAAYQRRKLRRGKRPGSVPRTDPNALTGSKGDDLLDRILSGIGDAPVHPDDIAPPETHDEVLRRLDYSADRKKD